MSQTQQAIQRLQHYVSQSVIGQEHVVKALLLGLLSNGHVLLEGVPGTAKTRSVKALSDALNSSFGRIQFTPDLLPSDVTGTEVYQEVSGKPTLTFQPGPIFNSIVLADEINRAPAKVQAALLEAMAEGTLTVAGETHQLPDLFMVLATQNPIEQEGTYPLPEAQMDRFMMKVTIDYPDGETELAILRLLRLEEKQLTAGKKASVVTEPISVEDILAARIAISEVHISELVEKYIIALVMATRQPELYQGASLERWVQVGASPRASIALERCARAHAWLNGHDFVSPDDVRAVIHSVLGHRLTLSFEAMSERISDKQVIDELLEYVAVGE